MKRVNSTVLLVFSMALVSILCLLLGVSYSYILSNGSAATNTETINTGNLNANITINNTELGNISALPDNEGMELDNYATVEIQKNSDYSVYYQLNLEYTSTFSTNNLSDYLPLENLVVALYKVDNGAVGGTPIMGPIRVADLPIVKNGDQNTDSNNSILKAQYQLYIGKFETGNQTAKYALKAWVAEDASDDFNGKNVQLDLTVNQAPYYSKSTYNLNFELDSTATGAEIYLNGQKAESNKISNIPEGIYTLIVKKDNKTYETTLTIKPGVSIALNEVKTECSSMDSLQKQAYCRKTTVYQIMEKDTSISSSNNTVKSSSNNLPKSYELTVKPSLDVQEIKTIKLTLNSDDITLTYNASNTIQAEGLNMFESIAPSIEMSDGSEGGVTQP